MRAVMNCKVSNNVLRIYACAAATIIIGPEQIWLRYTEPKLGYSATRGAKFCLTRAVDQSKSFGLNASL